MGRTLAATAAVSVALAVWQLENRKEPAVLVAPIPEEAMRQEPEPRPVYPYSVIPGGVMSAAELQSSLDRDKPAAHHYSDFHVDRAVLVLARGDRSAYVSYRAQGRIYWTSYRVRIKSGERLMTDGRSYARTRCGNRISEQPQQPTAKDEPIEEALSYLPPPIPTKLIRFPSDMETPPNLNFTFRATALPRAPALIESDAITPTVRYPAIAGPSRVAPAVQPRLSDVPEPGTAALLGAGVLGLALLRARVSHPRSH